MKNVKIKSFLLSFAKDVLVLHSSNELIVVKYQKKIFCIKNFAKNFVDVGYIKSGQKICSLFDRLLYIDWCEIDELKELIDLSDEKTEKEFETIKKNREYIIKKINKNKWNI